MNTSNLSSQFKLAKSFRGGGMDNFVKAKKEITTTFGNLTKCLADCNKFSADYKIASEDERDIDKLPSEVSGFLAQVSSISEIISGDQMKVAFFGRTSNGKSTTVNAVLQDKILPMGIGHTTSCFLSIHGSDEPDPYILVPGSIDKKKVESLDELADALSQEKLDHSSLVQVFWPKSRCNILSEDVVLVDSPGIDVSPDLDLWIDEHCLDADVFVLVANAESTLSVAEKHFFHEVNQRLSRPNIFIINNKWDASASEPDRMEQVKDQHLSRNISFLVDELQCVDKRQAEERVFFVSAKETLSNRMEKSQGMPQGGGAIYVEGFGARQLEFENFEWKLKECISKSAIKTKFESHAVSGLKIAKKLKILMEQRVGYASQQRSTQEKAKKEQENRLKFVKEQLEISTREIKCLIKEITSKVEDQVTEAMTEEIGRVGLLVNEFNHPFISHPAFLGTYKKKLCDHLARGLGWNMTACLNVQTEVICKAQKDIADRFRSLLPPETLRVSLEPSTPALDFNANLGVNVRRLCADFQEDIKFRFSLSLQAILRKLLRPGPAIALEANIQSLVPTTPAVVQALTSPTTLTATLVVIVGGLTWKTVGWRFTALCGGLYSGVYVFERVRWTYGGEEESFKRQFVDYSSGKLQSEVSVMSARCSGQVRQELTSTFAKLEFPVLRKMENLRKNIVELDQEITKLEKIEKKSIALRNDASRLESELSQFITEFGLEKSKI